MGGNLPISDAFMKAIKKISMFFLFFFFFSVLRFCGCKCVFLAQKRLFKQDERRLCLHVEQQVKM
jgi:hypothetical protein